VKTPQKAILISNDNKEDISILTNHLIKRKDSPQAFGSGK
jgi:hypothetical protein